MYSNTISLSRPIFQGFIDQSSIAALMVFNGLRSFACNHPYLAIAGGSILAAEVIQAMIKSVSSTTSSARTEENPSLQESAKKREELLTRLHIPSEIPSEDLKEHLGLETLSFGEDLLALRFSDQSKKISLSSLKEEDVPKIWEILGDMKKQQISVPEEVLETMDQLRAIFIVKKMSNTKKFRFLLMKRAGILPLEEELKEFEDFKKVGMTSDVQKGLQSLKMTLGKHKDALPFLTEISDEALKAYEEEHLFRAIGFNLFQIHIDALRHFSCKIRGREIDSRLISSQWKEKLKTEKGRKEAIDRINTAFKTRRELQAHYAWRDHFVQQTQKNLRSEKIEEGAEGDISSWFCVIALLEELDQMPTWSLEEKHRLLACLQQGFFAEPQVRLCEKAQALYREAGQKRQVEIDEEQHKVIHRIETEIFSVGLCQHFSAQGENLSMEEKTKLDHLQDEEKINICVYGRYDVTMETNTQTNTQVVSYRKIKENPHFGVIQ